MSHIKRILQYATAYKRDFYLNVFYNILYSILSVFSVLSIKPVLDIILNDSSQTKAITRPVFDGTFSGLSLYLEEFVSHKISYYVLDYGNVKALLFFCTFTIFAFFFRSLSRYMASYHLVGLRANTAKDIRDDFYKKILRLPVAYFTDQRKGDTIARITSDVSGVEINILGSLVEITRSPFMLFTSLIMLFTLDVELSLFSLIVLPFMGGIIAFLGKRLKKNMHKVQVEFGKTLSLVDETLNAVKIIKIFGASDSLINVFKNQTLVWKNNMMRFMRQHDMASPMSEFLGSIALVSIFWFGGREILEGNSNMNISSFLIYIGLFFQMLEPAKSLTKSFTNLKAGEASAERIFQIFDLPEPFKDKDNALSITDFNKEITFNNIDFSYDLDQGILQEFNLTINKGETVALVGQSGSGKTTIANLLARFYDVTKGEITIDGTPITDLKLEDYRQLLGMVTQESILFNDSIANNMRLAKENATEEEIIAALKVANAWEFVEKLPKKLNANVGEGGSKLSGGQKQRLSIARAVLKNPPIMILDEATSALDSNSEHLVQKALDKIMANRTSLVIAHRLSTIQKADKIIVMEQGKIVEQGSHKELLAKGGRYTKLVEMQNFG